jgi:DNA-binding LacI/PurR family transcriptional regulator
VAGVSVSTVSRILNDKPDVAERTRQRVKQVMDELGYAPHALAQRLAANRSRSIALIFPLGDQIDRGEVAVFIVRTALAAENENYVFSLVVAPTTKSRLLNLYRSAQIEGLILMEIQRHDWRVELLKKQQHPFVMIGRCEDNTGLRFVDLDFAEALLVAVEHLVNLRHQRIAIFNSGTLLRAGYGPAVCSADGIERARASYPVDLVVIETETPAEAVSAFMASRATAVIFAVYTPPMMDILRPIIQQGYRIPEDLSVICIQRDEVAQNQIQPLTSVRFDINAAADRAAKMLIDQLEGRSADIEQIILPPQLVLRESTAVRSLVQLR